MNERPKNCDPVAHAMHNLIHATRQLAAMTSSVCEAGANELDLAQYEEPIGSLLRAVERAAGELEGQGPKSQRIALQLMAALCDFERDSGPMPQGEAGASLVRAMRQEEQDDPRFVRGAE